jgi:2-isopropylmalate synthase
MIADSVKYFKDRGRQVFFDAEHFFDGYKADAEYAVKTLQVAADNGAECLVLCDTNGGMLPHEIEEITRTIIERFPQIEIGIHAHNDGEVGVANTLAAVRVGATHVQGTMNGYGERVGNANLVSVIPNLQLKMDFRCVSDEQLMQLSQLSYYIHEISNVTPDTHQPFVGDSAFAHKGGIHVSAVLKVEESYQHIDPRLIGNDKRALVSEVSGKSNILYKASEFGIDMTSDKAKQILVQIKEMESKGHMFEGAEASVKLMLHRAGEGYIPPFEVIDFMVVAEDRRGPGVFTEATVKVKVDNDVRHTVAEGNGPVDALNNALRKALNHDFPQLSRIHLTDYKVRILDSDFGTASTTRVMIDFHEEGMPHSAWTTVGAHTNIIEASWRALIDGIEYGLLTYKN